MESKYSCCKIWTLSILESIEIKYISYMFFFQSKSKLFSNEFKVSVLDFYNFFAGNLFANRFS